MLPDKIKFPVLCVVEGIPKDLEKGYPWQNGDRVILLGEISNMRGHYIVTVFYSDRGQEAVQYGRVFSGYHGDFFRLHTDEDD